MTTPTRLAPVPREVRPRPAPPPAPEPPPRRAPFARRPDTFGRVLRWSLLLSVLAHLVLLLVSPSFIRIGHPPGTLAGADSESSDAAGPILEWIVPVPSARVEASEAVADRRPVDSRAEARPQDRRSQLPSAVQVRPGGDGPAEPAASQAESGGGGSAGEALRPGYRDPRLWVNPRELRIERETPRHEQYMEHLQARVDALNDSIYRGGPVTDWTVKDKDGKRWGLSEDGLHLGGVTIPREILPLPRTTGTNQTLEEQRERDRQREEIRRQEGERERDAARRQGADATRERRDSTRSRGGGGG